MVSASIVTYHTELTELQRCMECLLAVSDMAWVMIVDNGEESRISDFLASVFPEEMETRRVRYTAEPNRGYGAVLNKSNNSNSPATAPKTCWYKL